MSIKIEKEIQSSLSKGQSPIEIASKLLKKKTISQSPDNFLYVCRFMYLAGLHQMLIQAAIQQLSKKQVAPWSFIIDILSSHQLYIPQRTRNYFLKGIKEQNQIQQILTNRCWDEYHPELYQWKAKTMDHLYRKNNQDLIKLMEDLDFIRSQGVLNKEEEILKKLKKADPKNPNIQEQWIKFKEKQSRQTIQQQKLKLLTTPHSNKNPPNTEEQQTAKEMFYSALKILKNNPKASHDIAVLFSFIGYPRLAVKILEKHLSSSVDEWLYVDLLLQSKLYIQCLSVTDYMEIKYKDDPNTVSALTYIRAIAYYSLGKKAQAKNILTELAKVRPNYRLTHFLLEQWKKEDQH